MIKLLKRGGFSVLFLSLFFVGTFLVNKTANAETREELENCITTQQANITGLAIVDPNQQRTAEEETLLRTAAENEIQRCQTALDDLNRNAGSPLAPTPTPTPSTTTPSSTTLFNPLGTTSIEDVVGRIIKIVISFAGVGAFLMFIWGGILWMTSAGNSERIEKGKSTLIWASIGLVVLFTSYAIVATLIKAITTGQI